MPSLHDALKGCCDFSPCVEKTARRQTGKTRLGVKYNESFRLQILFFFIEMTPKISSYTRPNTVGQNIINQFMGPVANSPATNKGPSFQSQNTETQFYKSPRSPAKMSTDQNYEVTGPQTYRNAQQGPQAKFEPFQIQLKSAAGGSPSRWKNWGDWSICRSWFSIVKKRIGFYECFRTFKSQSCGSGVQTRHRECNDGSFCPGRNYEEKVCETPCSQSSYWPSY